MLGSILASVYSRNKFFQFVPSLLHRFAGHPVRHGSNFSAQYHYDMRSAYFRHFKEAEQCHITFHLTIEPLKLDKVFNFNRNITEQIDTSIERMQTNIEKEYAKKNKLNNKNRKASSQSVEDKATASETKEESQSIVVSIGTASEKFTQISIAELLEKIANDSNVRLTIHQHDFQILLNHPEVLKVTLPSSILAGFHVHPSKLELLFATQECSEFSWYQGLMPKSQNAKEIHWTEIGKGLIYMVQISAIGCHLKFKCTPKHESGKVGPAVEIISSQPVQAGPGQCPFEVRHLFTQQKLKDSQFRVVSYNLLADLYSDSEHSRNVLFGYCMPYALEIDYRKQLFIKEILGYKADIICLQEVDEKIFHSDLVPIFQQQKYSGHYRSKGKVAEGLATFYDVNKFEVLEINGVIISKIMDQYPEIWEKIRNNEPLIERIAKRSTALQLAVFRSKHDSKKHLIVANTHLYFHPDADHVRLLQFGFGMLYVREQYERIQRKHQLAATDLALLFCGDFNSVPECGIYKLMTERFVGPDFVDWESNKQEAVKNVSLAQPFAMKSACGCPQFTNYTIGFNACIDYIFYQEDVLRVNDVIPMPSNDDVTMYEAIPSPVFPSDHIALVANLDWIS